jgi:hypothetical protein
MPLAVELNRYAVEGFAFVRRWILGSAVALAVILPTILR